MKRLWLILAGLLLGGGMLMAQEKYSIAESYFTPLTYYVGDEVELHLVILPAGPLTVVKSKDFPSQPWVEIKNVDIVFDQPYYQITIRFVSYAPGTRTLPKLVLGDLSLDNLRIFTTSLLGPEGGDSLAPPREQLLVPQTELVLFLLLVLVIALPLGLWRLVWWLRGNMGRVWQGLSEGSPLRNLQRAVRRLGTKAFGLPADEFYTQLTKALRIFLDRHYQTGGETYQAMTTPELAVALAEKLREDDALKLQNLFKRADAVVFGGLELSDAQRLDDLETVRQFAQTFQQKEAGDVDV